MSRAVRIILGIVVALVILLAVAGGLVWWKLASLKQQLVADLGKALGAQVQVASLHFDLWNGEIHAAGITLVNQRPSAPWQKGDISQATVRFKLGDLLAPTLPLSVEVSTWNVFLHSPLRTAETPPAMTGDAGAAPDTSPGSPGRVRVTKLTADNGTVEMDFSDDRKVVAQGVSFNAEDNGLSVWTTQVNAASITADTLQAGSSAVQIRGEPGKLTFSDLHMQCAQGFITGEGTIGLDTPHAATIDLKATGVPVEMLVSVNWRMKLTGLATGDLHYVGSDTGGGATGKIAINHGKFSVFPWLGKITAMAGLQDISDVEVDQATSDFTWKDGALEFGNLDVRKNDVTRIGGTVDLDSQGNVDGRLKLGLPSTATAKWPQLQTQVFPVAQDGFNWADVHITGTANQLQEDLTPRVLQAGLGTGSDLLNSAVKQGTDLFHSLMGK